LLDNVYRLFQFAIFFWPIDKFRMKGWGSRITEARKGAGLSQIQFGELIGAAQGTVSGWETEGSELSLAQFERIAEITGYNVCWIVFGIPPKKPNEAPDLDNIPLDRRTVRNVVYAITSVMQQRGIAWTPETMARNTIAFHDTFEGDPLEEIVAGVSARYKKAKSKEK
jgi:transcriptional regulator with XRE-family HTH domain